MHNAAQSTCSHGICALNVLTLSAVTGFETVSLHISGWPEAHYIDQTGLQLVTISLPLLKFQECGHHGLFEKDI